MAKRKRYEDYMLLATGEVVQGNSARYLIERVVGMGAFGAVYAVRDPALPGQQLALKEFFPARHPREQRSLEQLFEREQYVGMQASPHPLMPTFIEAFANDGHFYIAQEFIEGTTLDEIILKRHPLPRDWTIKWAVSLCDALAFLHSRQIVHHDLKPPNIRIRPQGHLTLLDFGAAQYFGKGTENKPPTDLYGTEGYLPPELEDGQWTADVRTDIFALGCILYEMIAGVSPDQEQINQRSMYVTNTLINQPNADLNLVRLINIALSYNTEYRFASANDFLLEMRKIAPPLLLVSKTHLDFGEVQAGQVVAARTMTLYNAGGGEIRGEIKPRSPWITVRSNSFTGNKHDITVQAAVSKIADRNTPVTGRLEINTADETDDDGNVRRGDRWFIECSVTVLPKPGQLIALERQGLHDPPLEMTGRKGTAITTTLTLKNLGELASVFHVAPEAAAMQNGAKTASLTVEATPQRSSIAPNTSLPVQISIRTNEIPAGVYETAITLRTNAEQTLTVPISLRVLSPLDFIKSMLGRR